MPDYSQIRNILQSVRRRRKAVAFASGAMLLVSALLLIAVAAGACGDWATVVGPARAIFLSFSLAALSIVAIRLLFLLVSYDHDDALALEIEKHYPGLKSKLISSVQLGREMGKGATKAYFADSLIEALLESTEADIEHIKAEQIIGGSSLKRSGLLMSVCFLGALFAFGFSPKHFLASVRGLFHPSAPKIQTALQPEQGSAVIGDITLHYSFPAYSRLESRTIRNSSGDIRVLRGSEVRVSARVSHAVGAANLVIRESDKIPMTVSADSRIEGRLSVAEKGYYQFEVIPPNGAPYLDRKRREIAIEPDEAPRVSLIWPAENIVATERETVQLVYEASDDFGLNEVSLVATIGGKEKRVNLASLSDAPKKQKGAYAWRLGDLDLENVQELSYFVEAKDNDNVSGPKTGKSETRHIAIQNARKRHEDLIARQEELLKRMLHLLAVDLTGPLDAKGGLTRDEVLLIESTVSDNMMSVLDLFGEIIAAMKDDSLANYAVYYALEDMRKELEEITVSRKRHAFVLVKSSEAEKLPKPVIDPLVEAQREQIEIVEKDILALNGLIGKQRLENIRSDMKKLTDAKESLAGLLDKLRKSGDAASLKELEDLAAEIEKMIQKIADETAKLMKDTPIGAFLNPDAMAGPGDLLEKLKEALARGDREEAMRLAQEMLRALDGFASAFANADMSYSKSAYGGILGQMNDLMTKLDELAQAENGVLKETNDLKKAMQQRTHEELDDTLREFFDRQLKRLEKIKSNVKGADAALGRDRDVKEYFLKDEERHNALERRRNLMGVFGLMEPEHPGPNLKEKLDQVAKEISEASKFLEERKGARDPAGLMRDIPQIEERLRQLEEMLSVWDVQESHELAMDVGLKLNYWQQMIEQPPEKTKPPACQEEVGRQTADAAAETARMLDDLEKMRRWLEDYQQGKFHPDERKAMHELSDRQRGIMEKTGEVKNRIDELQKQSPFIKDDLGGDVSEAMGRMNSARSKLDGQRPGSAVTEEREAVYNLEKAKSRLQEGQQRIAKGMMGGGMQMPRIGQEQEGMLGVRLERVKLPSPDDYKVPEKFREDILDAMKGAAPKEYRKLNKDYYKKLLEQ